MNIESTEAITTKAMTLALDTAVLRHQAIATNIANANAIGYVPLTVSFGDQLAEALSFVKTNGEIDVSALDVLKPQLTQARMEDGSLDGRVNADMEMAEMARNAVHYQSLLKGLTHHYRLLSMAAGDGKR